MISETDWTSLDRKKRPVVVINPLLNDPYTICLLKERAAKYDLKQILRNTESTVIRECADTSTAIDTIDGFTLFKKKDVRLDPNYLNISKFQHFSQGTIYRFRDVK